MLNVVEPKLITILGGSDDAGDPGIQIAKVKRCASCSPDVVPDSALLQELFSEVLEVPF